MSFLVSRLREPRVQTCILGIIFLFTAWRFLEGFQDFYGVDPYDESIYLQFASKGYFRSAWSPLYLVYYRALLFLFSGDALRSYYFNIGFLTVALPAAHFFLLRRLSVGPLLSYGSAFYALVASFNGPLFAKAGHFNLVFVYLGLIAISFLRESFERYVALVAILILAIFIRQDMAVPALFAVIMLVVLIKKGQISLDAQRKRILIELAGLVFFLFAVFGNVLSGGRSWQVFLDTFYFNSASQNVGDRTSIAEKFFTSSKSVSDALFANHEVFFWHIKTNLAFLPGKLKSTIVEHFPIGAGEFKSTISLELAVVVFLLTLALTISFWTRLRSQGFRFIKLSEFERVVVLATVGLIIKSAVVTTVFWSGTTRYFLEGIFAFLILFALFVDRFLVIRSSVWMSYLMAVALAIAVPSHNSCSGCQSMSPISKDISAKEFILFMNGKNIEGGTCFYSGSYDVFFHPKLKCTQSGSAWFSSYPSATLRTGIHQSLRSYIDAKNFDYIIASKLMREQLREFDKENELEDLLKNHHAWGFKKKIEVRTGEFILSR